MRLAQQPDRSHYEETIEGGGLRDTPQRRHVYDELLQNRDHPTATEVFMRVKQTMPTISLATVYNSLETLVACGLVKQVNVDREPTRYCPNLEEHGHFVCEQCSHVFDLALATSKPLSKSLELPPGFTITACDVTVRGTCATCNALPKTL